jgi:hypothetical protein
MSRATCHHVTLAQNAIAQVQRCTECDCISLHIGPTTLRIDPHALEALWAVLGEAAVALQAQKQTELCVRGVA